ncbi:DUF2267 domain-containing protein [Haladaptatus halobius]|uniref:DUF2267 domain-containing protein n=1 Tax=Haladaptatus halobius TaxID=2884875 RepID=UPI001D0A593F|nr:DUF2267 domain-containing protein [Haladaptatus halobius]
MTRRGFSVTLAVLISRWSSDLAGPLPMQIDRYLLEAESGQRFDWNGFLDRVWKRENMADPDDQADTAYHARVIVDVMSDVVPLGEMQQVHDGLPDDEDWDELFELVGQDTQ